MITFKRLIASLLVLIMGSSVLMAEPTGTVFTYQGRLAQAVTKLQEATGLTAVHGKLANVL